MFFAYVLLLAFVFLLRLYFRGGQCKSDARLDGKTVLITGCNSGIGKETALELYCRGARVLMACRSPHKMRQAADDIMATANSYGTGSLAFYELDLSELKSVRQCAKEIDAKEDRIDVLINNAGVMDCPFGKNSDGLELHMATNHFGPFLLTNLLLHKIKSSAPSRIIAVSSKAHNGATMNNLEDINWDRRKYHPHRAYAQSKLANILFTRELARKLKGTGVNCYCVHPGMIPNNEGNRGMASFKLLPFWLCSRFFFKTPRDAAQTTIDCAVNPLLASETGKYYSDCQEKMPSVEAQDDVMALKLWELSEQIVAM